MSEESGSEFLDCLKLARNWEPGEERPKKPLHNALKLFDKGFLDENETVVIIDEIQESATVYYLIREFTRIFQCRFIVTGSYLGRILNEDFKLSAGDLTALRVETLTFEEFAEAPGAADTFKQLGLFGGSEPEQYKTVKELYDIYCQTGGYPAVVTEYLETKSIPKCREKLEDVIWLFCSESSRYFEDLDFAGKITECKILDFKARSRCFFADVGLTRYFLRKVGADNAAIEGLIMKILCFGNCAAGRNV